MTISFLRWSLLASAAVLFSSCGNEISLPATEDPQQVTADAPAASDAKVFDRSNTPDKNRGGNPHDTPAVVPPVGGTPVFDTPAKQPTVMPDPDKPMAPPAVEEYFCGDGVKNDGEQCDDGNDKAGDECDNFCRKVRCGNSEIEGEEQCDAPGSIYCTKDCQLILCGNNEVDEGETCDPPSLDGKCNANCQTSVCGNGTVEYGEQCDDGNDVATDGCNTSCNLECTAPADATVTN